MFLISEFQTVATVAIASLIRKWYTIVMDMKPDNVQTMVAHGPVSPGNVVSPDTIARVAHRIADRFHPEKIVVFGSYANGKARPGSDLDLLVVMETNEPQYKRSVPIRLLFEPSPCPMDILVYTPDEAAQCRLIPNHIVAEALNHGNTVYERAAD